MTKQLAMYLSVIIIADLRRHCSRDLSSYECELLEQRLMQGKYDEVEQYISRYL
jgi:hypothetical protein